MSILSGFCTTTVRLYYYLLLYYYCTTTVLRYYGTTVLLLRAPAPNNFDPGPPKQLKMIRQAAPPEKHRTIAGFGCLGGGVTNQETTLLWGLWVVMT